MYLFGHLGIGSQIVSPWTKNLSPKAVFVGALLPDLIDKPLYYGLSFFTHLRGAELGLISGTRTIGHTGAFLILVSFLATVRKSRILAAVSLGMASHLILDAFHGSNGALLWPLTGWSFPEMQYQDLAEQVSQIGHPWFLGCEILGFTILAKKYWKHFRRKSA